MYVHITGNDGLLMTRELHHDEILDCDLYAAEYARSVDMEVEAADNMPDDCGDFRVTLSDYSANEQIYHARIWTAKEYMFVWDGV